MTVRVCCVYIVVLCSFFLGCFMWSTGLGSSRLLSVHLLIVRQFVLQVPGLPWMSCNAYAPAMRMRVVQASPSGGQCLPKCVRTIASSCRLLLVYVVNILTTVQYIAPPPPPK